MNSEYANLQLSMAGVYIHIPFCSKACHYCNFHFSTSLHRKPEVVRSIVQEIHALQAPDDVIFQKQVDTIYFGGGTPSLLTHAELNEIMRALHRQFEVSPDAEITLEANPDNISPTNLRHWKSAGINRLSIGIQSFELAELVWMNRAHNSKQALESIQMVRQADFDNFSIDLIYGLPVSSASIWQKNLETAIALEVPHISCYALTVEERTALHHFIAKGKANAPDESEQASLFSMMTALLTDAGYEHYEISNLALPGFRSKHNSAYWTGRPYYGFGPSAHSFDGKLTRWWNVGNNNLYIQAVDNGSPMQEFERLTTEQRINEMIMTGIRRIEGISIDADTNSIEELVLTRKQWDHFESTLHELQQEGLIFKQGGRVVLMPSGKFMADGIASRLFVEY